VCVWGFPVRMLRLLMFHTHCAPISLQAELAAAAASAESDRRALHALEGRVADAESRARAAAAERDAAQRRAQEAANAAAGDSAQTLTQARDEAAGLRDQLARLQARLEAVQQQVRAW
jgi:chromosome segregation ATPase